MSRWWVGPRQRLVWLLVIAAVSMIIALGGGFVYRTFVGCLPQLEGQARVAGLEHRVVIERDAAGVPTIRAEGRLDLARALGFLHGQERFFQMDLMRRAGAGELSELFGSQTLQIDLSRRRHRFRRRAEAIFAEMPEEYRNLLEAYAAGVNAGLQGLSSPPFEYSILRSRPAPWQAIDSLLTIDAMYFDLEESDGWSQQRRALLLQALGPSLVDFLYPHGNPYEAPIDGAMLPEQPMPLFGLGVRTPALLVPGAPPAPNTKGSNSFAVAGKLTSTGAAMVANDEHLKLQMPNIWYRARMIEAGSADSPLDISGTTLPGVPFVIAGSNTHVAWGFTNSYISTGDAIMVDLAPNDPGSYLTPEGPKPFKTVTERVCMAHDSCHELTIEETIWGPVVARAEDGQRIVWRWLAHDSNSIDLKGEMALERAKSVREALDAAHEMGLPDQNMLVGDRSGHIGWSIAGRVPRRIGLDDGLPHSWADGTHRWQGFLAPNEIPEIVDPPSGRLWTANNRIVGGSSLALLGDGGYDQGDRARQIRDDLSAKENFVERDLLEIQLDDRAVALSPWQRLLLEALTAHQGSDPRFAEMLPFVRDWRARADPDSVGYRLVRTFESEAVGLLYSAFAAPIAKAAEGRPVITHTSMWPVERLLTERKGSLVPAPFHNWDEITLAILNKLALAVANEAGSDLKRFTWGERNHAGIHHPLSGTVPLLGLLTDPKDQPMAGDSMMPRVISPGFGATERFVVSPGNEASGILEMAGGQAGNPLAPYYLAGHQDWIQGLPSPFLPGAVHWRLMLEPSQK